MNAKYMKVLTRAYVLALLIIATVVTLSQILVQRTIMDSRQDSNVVNISGRQRMLSQKITKSALQMVQSNDSIEFHYHRGSLEKSLTIWQTSHRSLQEGGEFSGDSKTGNSAEITALFRELEPSFKAIQQGANELLDLSFESLKGFNDSSALLEQITKNEEQFLFQMNKITFQYDAEARDKIDNISRKEFFLYALAIVLLILEALLIFRPAISSLKKTYGSLIEREKQLVEARVEQSYLEELEAKNKELEGFTYITSHDLQEPLKSIKGFANVLEKRTQVSADKQSIEMIRHIKGLADRSSSMIYDLLKYTQLGDSERTSDLEQTNFNELIEEVKQSINELIVQNEAEVAYDKLPTLEVSRTDMTIVFQNLITNAIKYKSKERLPLVEIKHRYVQDYDYFSVVDNGIGIPRDRFDEIFLIFRRLNVREEDHGNGIGLAMCKKIIDNLKGRIWVESEVGMGTTIHFRLPRKP